MSTSAALSIPTACLMMDHSQYSFSKVVLERNVRMICRRVCDKPSLRNDITCVNPERADD